MAKPRIIDMVLDYVLSRVRKGIVVISSHEIESDCVRYIEKVTGKTVNPSTVSRKWRLLKIENNDEAQLRGELMLRGDDGYVIVREISRKTRSTEGRWKLININGTAVDVIYEVAQQQLELFPQGSEAK